MQKCVPWQAKKEWASHRKKNKDQADTSADAVERI